MDPFRITRLVIRGFRRIQAELALDLRDPGGGPLAVAVLGGSNGSGKTSVLEALLLALGREDLIVRDLPSVERGDHWRGVVPPGAQITVTLERPNPEATLFKEPGTGRKIRLTRTADAWRLEDLDRGGSEGNADALRRLLGALQVEYFSSWRAPVLPGPVEPTTSGRPPANTEGNRLRLFKQRVVNQAAARSFRRTETSRDTIWLERLNEAWRHFHAADGTAIAVDVLNPAADDPGGFDLFVEADGARVCSVDQTSSGELELLAFASALVVQEFTGLLLVDEPELHLHPEWRAGIMDALRALAPRAQIIVATHADEPWDQAMSFERFLLVPPDDLRSEEQRQAASAEE